MTGLLIAVGSLLTTLVALTAALLLFRAFQADSLPDLEPRHRDRVGDELRQADCRALTSLSDYLERERRLMERVAPLAPSDTWRRFADPAVVTDDVNCSFEIDTADARFGVLALHGLSDSPYYMRALGRVFADQGGYVLGLRLPGHGTLPGGLLSVTWRDWWAATEFGVRSVLRRIGTERPLVLAGFSTGGALCLHYALTAGRAGTLPQAERLFLFSTAVELPWTARLSHLHRLLSWHPRFAKFAWVEVRPDVDPCKYDSFPKAAAREIYKLTRENARLVEEAATTSRPTLPRLYAYQSVADATVSSPSVTRLFERLGSPRDELVLFDLNHLQPGRSLLGSLADEEIPCGPAGALPARLALVSNRDEADGVVTVLAWPGGTRPTRANAAATEPLGERWPPEAFSLSHVALPVSPDDPLYGRGAPLANLAPRGERGVLATPVEDLMRLRYNPFFGFLRRRIQAQLAES